MRCKTSNMIRLLVIIIVFLSAAGCSRGDEGYRAAEMQKHFEAQARSRMKEFAKLGDTLAPLKQHVIAVHEKVNELILLSKDIENPGAAVALSNAYFGNLAAEQDMRLDDFARLATGMHVDEVGMLLRRNELNYFNLLLLKQGGVTGMFTAQ